MPRLRQVARHQDALDRAGVVNLSGGNQQKIVIAKWVARSPKILIVDEPTRGIDIGAKAEVHALLAGLACDGMGDHRHLVRPAGGAGGQRPGDRH